MAIKKVRIRPEGGNNYADILHPETSADVVKFSDGTTVEAHKTQKATQTTLGHVKAGQNITIDSSGTISAKDTITTINGKTGVITKADIVALGIPAQDTTYGIATTSTDGLMSATDKAKLNGIEAGANKTIINNTLTSTSTTQALSARQGKTLKDDLDAHKAEDVHHRIVVGGFFHDGTEETRKVVVGFRPKYVECRTMEPGDMATGGLLIFDDTNDKVFIVHEGTIRTLSKGLAGVTIHNDGFYIALSPNTREVNYIAIG